MKNRCLFALNVVSVGGGGHRAYKCQYETRCRYCSSSHDSQECFQKIKDNVEITPKCCNWGGEHNANSRLCKKRPVVSLPRSVGSSKDLTGYSGKTIGDEISNNQVRPVGNVWEQRIKNSLNLEGQNCDALVALRMEVEQLKNLVLTLQSQVNKVCNVADVSSTDSLDSRNEPVRDTRSFGRSDVEVHALDTSSQVVGSPSSGRPFSVNGRQSEDAFSSNHVQNMTGLLDAALNYMQAPSDKLRINVITNAKRFREQVTNKYGSV